MKIIAKAGDYYDYLTGIYGIDPVLVYDRRDGTHIDPANYNELSVIPFAICGKIYTVVKYKDKFLNTPEQLQVLENEKEWLKRLNWWGWTSRRKLGTFNAKKWYDRHNNWSTKLNKEHREPILLLDSNENVNCKPLTIQDFGFPAFYPAHEIYEDISNFLGWMKDNPPIPDKQTDKEKVVSHGFDLKQSFRHRK